MIDFFKGALPQSDEKSLCDEKLVVSHASMEAIVNPNHGRTKIHSNKSTLESYCQNNVCPHRTNCSEDTRKKILSIFDTFDKEHKN